MGPNRAKASPNWLSHPIWVAGDCILSLGLSLAGATAAMHGHWATAAAWLVCASIGVGAIVFRKALPPFFGLLLTVGASVNTAGYVQGLWHERTPFDEIVHGFTAFAGMAAAGWFVLRRRSQLVGLFWKAALIGLLVGLAWEGFEWAIGIMGDLRDTIIDLVMDTAGALAAAALLRRLAGTAPNKGLQPSVARTSARL
jgi:hypothetical protein